MGHPRQNAVDIVSLQYGFIAFHTNLCGSLSAQPARGEAARSVYFERKHIVYLNCVIPSSHNIFGDGEAGQWVPSGPAIAKNVGSLIYTGIYHMFIS
jgi:hypothetical protein